MNNKNLRLIAFMLVGLNMIEAPVQATITDTPITIPSTLTPTPILLASTVYIAQNFLTREKFLVSKKFEAAQAWYDSLIIKYPEANLDKIMFIQTPKSDCFSDMFAGFVKKCNWISTSNHIYMSKDTLKEINFLYKKVIDGHALDDKEIGKLAGHEFTILHEAGHIKHNDAQTLLASIFLLFGTTNAIAHYNGDDITSTEDQVVFKGFKDIFGTTWFKESIPGTLTIVSTASFFAALGAILSYQQAHADTFAIETADLLALKNGLKSFANDDHDPLFKIEEKKSMSPYITSDSYIGKFFQNFVGSVETIMALSQHKLFIIAKSTQPTRYIFDLYWHHSFLTPSMRAQAVQNEIDKREQNN